MRQGNYRGLKRREERKKKHRDRVEAEGKQMREDGQPIKFEYWGWEPTDKSHFLRIRVYFKDPIIPADFKTEVEDALTEIFFEHL